MWVHPDRSTFLSRIVWDVQSGILAIGGTQQHVSLKDGRPTATSSMTVTLSADERVVDGDIAAAFLDAFAKNISNPVKLLSV